jgi:PleD family two-component response regulator
MSRIRTLRQHRRKGRAVPRILVVDDQTPVRAAIVPALQALPAVAAALPESASPVGSAQPIQQPQT